MSIMNVMIRVDDIEAPVSIHKAFDDKPVELNQLAPNGEPIRRINIDSNGEEVDYKDIVTGYKYAEGKYVIVDKDEVKALDGNKSSVIDIECVTNLASIDPMLFDTPYYLGLDSKADEGFATERYADLVALLEEGRVAIGELTMRGRDHVVAIYKGYGNCLMLSTLRYLDDMRTPPFELEYLPDEKRYARGDEIVRNVGVVAFNPRRYKNEYGDRMKALVANKVAAVTGVSTQGTKTKV